MTNVCASTSAKYRPELRIPTAAAQTRVVSGGEVWPIQRELSRHLKYMARARISEFESYHLSHAVRSLWGGSQPLQHAGWPMRSRAIAWNGFAERLIGSIRRECVDHLVVLGEAHLRWILTKYATYYNELRTHRSLNKDAPIRRAIQHVGRIVSAPILGGLHHHYCRI